MNDDSTSARRVDASAVVHPTAHVEHGATIGAHTQIWHGAHVREGVEVGEDCMIGKDTYLGTRTVVGHRVKIQNGCGIFGAVLEDEVMLAPGVYLIEDAAPRAVTSTGQPKQPADWVPDPVRVGRGATVGAGAVVGPGVTIGRYALVGIASAVTHDVPAHALVAGNPARQVGWVCRCGHRLDENLRCTVCGTPHVHTGPGLEASR